MCYLTTLSVSKIIWR